MTDAPPWARGFDLAFLKEVAALFRQEFKPHTHGAFGMPKERDVADAMADGALLWVRGLGGEIIGAAIARMVQRPQPHEDFAERRAVMVPGEAFVKAIAGTGAARILTHIAGQDPTGIWVEAHVENADLAFQLEKVWGFDRVMTKISAASDLKGLYFKGFQAGARPIALHPADAPGVKVLAPEFISADEAAAIMGEIEFARELFAQHYSSYNKRQSWTAFALRGYEPGDPSFIIKPSEMSRKWKDENPRLMTAPCLDTRAAGAFPSVWEVLGRIPVRDFQRVRFMRLSAGGGELTRHADITDPEAGTADGKVARLHIPIATHPECLFRSWGLDGAEHRLHMPERGLSYIDTRKPHAVINPAEIERIHLVVDAYSTPELRALISA